MRPKNELEFDQIPVSKYMFAFVIRKLIVIAMVLLTSSVYAQTYESLIKAEREGHAMRTMKSKRIGQNYDITYHYLDLNVDPAVREISGSVYTEIIALEPDFSQFSFDLDRRMTVDSVYVNGALASFTHSVDDIIITIQAIAEGEAINTTVFYRGDPSVNEYKGFSYGYQLAGPIAWTLSEPYGAYGWWPCKQQLVDKIDSVDISVTVPKGNKVGSLGLLKQVDTFPDSSLTYHWEHRHPTAVYLVAVAVTNYDEHSHYIHFPNGDSLYHLDYVYPAYTPAADTLRYAIDDMMVLFDTLFGPYPFMDEKYGHAQWGRGGGMEHQTMSFMSDLDFDLMAHELAHQWYGNKITCGSWRDLWLNEGFATYSNALAREFIQGKASFLEFMEVSRDRAISQPDGAVYAYDTTVFQDLFSGNIRYRKGAMVMQMLRWELGDEDFFNALRAYTADAELCYDFAVTPDFQYYLEAESGLDLDEFFERWVYLEGFPQVVTRWNRVSDEIIALDLYQSTSDPSVEFFPLRIEYLLKGEDRDSVVVIDHTSPSQVFEIEAGFKVVEVLFDPNIWLLAQSTVVEGDHLNLSGVNVYPNPASQQLSLYLKDKKVDRIEVVNIMGQTLFDMETPQLRNQQIDIPVGHLANGSYVLVVYSGDEVVKIRFLVARS